MPPKPVRGPTRRTSAALPQTQQANFLLEAAAMLSQSSPQLAAVLGRRALQVGDGEYAVMPRGAAATLCGRCGLPFTADVYQSGQVVKLPRHYVRRKLQVAAAKGVAAQPGAKQQQVNRAAVVYSCKLCGHNTVRPFYTVEAAQQAILRAGGTLEPAAAQLAQPELAAAAGPTAAHAVQQAAAPGSLGPQPGKDGAQEAGLHAAPESAAVECEGEETALVQAEPASLAAVPASDMAPIADVELASEPALAAEVELTARAEPGRAAGLVVAAVIAADDEGVAPAEGTALADGSSTAVHDAAAQQTSEELPQQPGRAVEQQGQEQQLEQQQQEQQLEQQQQEQQQGPAGAPCELVMAGDNGPALQPAAEQRGDSNSGGEGVAVDHALAAGAQREAGSPEQLTDTTELAALAAEAAPTEVLSQGGQLPEQPAKQPPEQPLTPAGVAALIAANAAVPAADTSVPAMGSDEDGEETVQQPPRKKRRISWKEELEEIQLIASTPSQPVPGAAAGTGGEPRIAGSPPGLRRRTWFRVGRAWKTGLL